MQALTFKIKEMGNCKRKWNEAGRNKGNLGVNAIIVQFKELVCLSKRDSDLYLFTNILMAYFQLSGDNETSANSLNVNLKV